MSKPENIEFNSIKNIALANFYDNLSNELQIPIVDGFSYNILFNGESLNNETLENLQEEQKKNYNVTKNVFDILVIFESNLEKYLNKKDAQDYANKIMNIINKNINTLFKTLTPKIYDFNLNQISLQKTLPNSEFPELFPVVKYYPYNNKPKIYIITIFPKIDR